MKSLLLAAMMPMVALGVTEGWENICETRTEFPVSKAVWTAKGVPDAAFVVEKCEGAEGDVRIADGVVSIRKTNDAGYILVSAPAFDLPAGTNELRLLADVAVKDGFVDTASGFLRAHGTVRDLSINGPLESRYGALGAHKEMRGMICTAPGMTYRKYTHYRATERKITPVIVVCGTPSESVWQNWTAEDQAAADAAWGKYYPTQLAKDHSADRTDAAAFARKIAADTVDHTAEVRKVDGYARFFVDGRPATPVLYKGKHMMADGSADERFVGRPLQQNGVKLMVKEVGFWSVPGFPGFGNKDGFDMTACVEEIRNAMRMADDSLFLLTLDLTVYPEFSSEHPDEVWKKPDGSTVLGSAGTCTAYKAMGVDFEGGKVWPWISYASPSWRALCCEKIRELVAALKREGLAKRIVGAHFAGFHDSQFSSPYVDLSPCAQAEYQRFLKEPNIASTNYCWFSKQIAFRSIEMFSRAFKEAMAKPVVTVRWCESAFMNYPPCACDITSFLNSDTVDILVAQSNYESRRAGMACDLRPPIASFHRHGKMYWEEFDLRTYGAMEPWASSGVPALKADGNAQDFPMWQAMFRRHVGRVAARRVGWWFYDMGGGWFEPPEIAADCGAVAAWYGRQLERKPSSWKPGVAIVLDEAGQKMWDRVTDGYSPAVCDIYMYQCLLLTAAGVPYDTYVADDWLRDPSLGDGYQMVCFVHFNKFDADRKALVERLSAARKTLLFFAESGWMGGAEATGFDVKTVTAQKSVRVRREPGCTLDVRPFGEIKAERNFRGAWPQEAFVDRRTHIVEKPGLKVLARYADDNTIALAETDVKGSHRIYAAPQGGITADLFNHWARQAGAYVATRPGVQVDMSGDFAMIHCLRPGRYDFRLPFPCAVRNLKSNRLEPTAGDVLTLELTAGETVWLGFERAVETAKWQAAIDAAAAAGGGRVTVPAGRHVVGALRLRSNVELHLADGAELVHSCDWNDFPLWKPTGVRSQKDIDGWCALVYAEGATNVAVTGRGTIDGCGAILRGRRSWASDAACDVDGRSRNLLFVSCRGVTVKDVLLKDPSMWTQHYFDCEDVLIEGARVDARVNFNNDGIDIDSCRRVTVRNCTIASADDAIVLKSTAAVPCADILVENCTLATQAAGFKIGTESLGDFRRVTARDLRIGACAGRAGFDHPNWTGKAISAVEVMSVDGANIEDVVIERVTAENVRCPIFLRLGNRSRPVHKGLGLAGLPPGRIRNVRLADFTVTNAGNIGSSVTAFAPGRIAGVVLANIRVRSAGGVAAGAWISPEKAAAIERTFPSPSLFGGDLPAKGLYLCHAGDVTVRGLQVETAKPDARPLQAVSPQDGLSGLRSMTPVPQNADPNSGWMRRHREKLAVVVTNKAVDVVFLGDSITDYWERRHFPRWKHWFGYGDLTALNLGFAADRTEHVLWRIRNGELDGYKAGVIVLEIGTNNAGQLSEADEPPADTILAMRTLIDEIRRHQPTAKVIVNAIFPRGKNPDDPVRRRNEVVNREVARLCNDFEVIWMDLNHRFLTPDGRLLPRIMPDYLHPSDEGYDIWASALLPVIREIVFSPGGRKTPYPKHLAPFVSDVGARDAPLEAVGETRTACWSRDFVKGPFGELWWLNRLYANRCRAAAQRGQTVDVVFLGDSITHFWEMKFPEEWRKVTERFSAFNFGYAGDTTQSVLWRIENGELDGYAAKTVVLLIGTNNASVGSTAEATAAGVKACVAAIRRKQPQAKILLHAIFPRGGEKPVSRQAHARAREVNERVNALLRAEAWDANVTWCDFTGLWTEPGAWGVPERLMPDGIHPSAEGYARWFAKLQQLL